LNGKVEDGISPVRDVCFKAPLAPVSIHGKSGWMSVSVDKRKWYEMMSSNLPTITSLILDCGIPVFRVSWIILANYQSSME